MCGCFIYFDGCVNWQRNVIVNYINVFLFDVLTLAVNWKWREWSDLVSKQTACINTRETIGSPESRVFILVALARVSASNWFNIMTYNVIILNQLLALTRASATRIKTRDSGLPMERHHKQINFYNLSFLFKAFMTSVFIFFTINKIIIFYLIFNIILRKLHISYT